MWLDDVAKLFGNCRAKITPQQCRFEVHFHKPLWFACDHHKHVLFSSPSGVIWTDEGMDGVGRGLWWSLERHDTACSVPRLFRQDVNTGSPYSVIVPRWLVTVMDSALSPLEQAALAWMYSNGDTESVPALNSLERLGASGQELAAEVHRRMIELALTASPNVTRQVKGGWLHDLGPIARQRVPFDEIRNIDERAKARLAARRSAAEKRYRKRAMASK